MNAGDTATIIRGERHFFVNRGSEPAAAFVTFAPPYDGDDNLPVD
jgi:mannose-6-phosphate isomerase-like protein (cupin superfamily)